MNTLYLDIFSGISGDMLIGALIDLGVPTESIERELRKLGLDGYHLHMARQHKGSIEGVKFDVHLAHGHEHHHAQGHTHEHEHTHAGGPTHTHAHSHAHPHEHHEEQGLHDHAHEHEDSRTFSQIKDLISRSALSDWVKQRSIAVFHRIAVAEGKIHGMQPDEVHFHEVGALDSIVDIIGACVGLEALGKPRVLASAVVEGVGWINCAHGRFPIPAPATLAILAERGIPITQTDEPHELVTPTGAALLAEFVEQFGPMRHLLPRKIGYGLGTRDNHTRPNVLRAVLCETERLPDGVTGETDIIAVLETNLDDLNAEILGHFVEKALAAGALDVFHTPIQMKKNRPGLMLTVLCATSDTEKFAGMMLRETSTFGVRCHTAERRKLQREFASAKTPWGEVTVKLGRLGGKVVQTAPEFESCKRLADEAGVPLKQVYEAALRNLKRET